MSGAGARKPKKKTNSPKQGVTISPKGTETVNLKHKHQQLEWKRQQELEELRDAEEIERLAAGDFLPEEQEHRQQVLSTSTGAVVSRPKKNVAPAVPPPAEPKDQFQGAYRFENV